jgi:imidazole glycerol-phosphate synthase subunit HisF
MKRIRVIPVLLVNKSKLVKTVKFRNEIYVGDPINAVKIFNDKGVDELIFLDITATVESREPDYAYLREIASECFMPLAYGGGIRTIDAVQKILSLGCEKVIINSYAIGNPDFIKESSAIFGNQSIVVALDIKRNLLGRYEIHLKNGKQNTHIDAVEFSKKMEAFGAGELFINSIDRDGVMRGYDIDLLNKITSSISIPVIACGGAGNLKDLSTAVNSGGASAVAAGSMFVFHGPHRAVLINYPSENELLQLFK